MVPLIINARLTILVGISELPSWLSGRESVDEGVAVSIPGSGRCLGERNGNPL